MASTYLYRTQVAGTSTQKMTFSAWVKRGELGSYEGLLNCYQSDANRNGIYFQPIDTLAVYFKTSSSTHIYYETNRKFRDVNAWYHIVVRIDTTQANASHRCRIYINGEEETSYSSTSGGSQNASFSCINQNNLDLEVGRIQYGSTTTAYFTGCMSHVHFIDGEDRTPDYFGATDSTTGEWKIKTNVTGVTYGNNGFFILEDDNSNLDRSGEGHNQTIGGTLTKTEDNPSNVFATFNVLNKVYMNSMANGNTTIGAGNNGTDFSYISATIGASSGKYYWEAKVTDLAEIDQVGVALASASFANIGTSHGLQATNYGGKGCQFSNGNKVGDGSGGAYMGGFSANDIMMIALDLDNTKITFGRNGQWADGSGNANQTYANSTAAYTNLTAGETYIPAHAMRASGGNTGSTSYNFGNGYFGTSAISSEGTNASGIGKFEYDVPTGFTALSTKGLNE